MQRAEFETKLNRVCLHIYKEEHYEEDYQMPMLRQNQLDGILKAEGCEVNGQARYTYEISGMTSMKTMYENTNMKKHEIEAVINRILEVTEILQCYMLNPNCLVLKPEYIFYKENNWHFCYLPGMEEDLCKLFHELTEYFVKMLDYQDTEGIFLAYELHKATLQEHYDLDQIMKAYKHREAERKKMNREKPKPVRQRKEIKEKSAKKPESAGGRPRKQESPEYIYKNQESTEVRYGKQTDTESDAEDFKGSYGEYKARRSGYGNIFSVTDEDEEEEKKEQKEYGFGRREQLYTADLVCEEKEGGWWKPWKKAANTIRGKRWGSWDDLILETDGQEEES